MDENNLKMVVNLDGFLTPKETENLLQAYYILFSKINGKDLPSALLQVLKLNKNQSFAIKLLNVSENYQLAKKALLEIKPNFKGNNLNMLMVYESNNLIAAARLRNLGDNTGSIPDAVFMVDEDKINIIWSLMIEYIENYFYELGYKKMYIEVPIKDPFLLKGCFDHDFRESPEDIVVKESTKTYFLNKNLERKRK